MRDATSSSWVPQDGSAANGNAAISASSGIQAGVLLDACRAIRETHVVELDRDNRLLRFDSEDELEAFHRELTLLLREVTVGLTASARDANEARARAQSLLSELSNVANLLNALRAPR